MVYSTTVPKEHYFSSLFSMLWENGYQGILLELLLPYLWSFQWYFHIFSSVWLSDITVSALSLTSSACLCERIFSFHSQLWNFQAPFIIESCHVMLWFPQVWFNVQLFVIFWCFMNQFSGSYTLLSMPTRWCVIAMQGAIHCTHRSYSIQNLFVGSLLAEWTFLRQNFFLFPYIDHIH